MNYRFAAIICLGVGAIVIIGFFSWQHQEQLDYLRQAPAERTGQTEPVDLRQDRWTPTFDTKEELIQDLIKSGDIDLGEEGLIAISEEDFQALPDRDQYVIVDNVHNYGDYAGQVPLYDEPVSSPASLLVARRDQIEPTLTAHDDLVMGLTRTVEDGPTDYEEEIRQGRISRDEAIDQIVFQDNLSQRVHAYRELAYLFDKSISLFGDDEVRVQDLYREVLREVPVAISNMQPIFSIRKVFEAGRGLKGKDFTTLEQVCQAMAQLPPPRAAAYYP